MFWHSRLKSSNTRCYKGPASKLKNNFIKSSSTEHLKKGTIQGKYLPEVQCFFLWTIYSLWWGTHKIIRVAKRRQFGVVNILVYFSNYFKAFDWKLALKESATQCLPWEMISSFQAHQPLTHLLHSFDYLLNFISALLVYLKRYCTIGVMIKMLVLYFEYNVQFVWL